MCVSFEIRRVTPEMQPALERLFAVLSAAKEEQFFLPHPLTSEQAGVITQYTGNDYYALAFSDDIAIAYGLLRGWDAGYEIPSLGISVHPDFRRHGIGLAMMHYLHAAAALRGSQKIRLRVNRNNVRATKLYQDLGYHFEDDQREFLVGYLTLKPKHRPRIAA